MQERDVAQILVACLGLYGLVAFTTVQRSKEISVRKVLGASLTDILLLVSKDCARLIVLATVIAVPLAYIGMERWLDGYAFRIALNTVLYEYLASHGYVVATVPQYGPRLDRRGMPYSLQGADVQRRDVEQALATLLRRPFVDARRIGLTGHSFGALVALWPASRNQDIDALVSLDGSIVIERRVELLRSFDWDPEAVRIPILNQYTLSSGERDRSIVDALHHAGRYHVIYQNGSHFDFQNGPLHVTLTRTGDPRSLRRRSHEEGRAIYLSAVQLTRHFFDAVLKGNPESLTYVRGEQPVLHALETTTFERQAGMKKP